MHTHTFVIPGIPEPIRVLADTDEAAAQEACDQLGLHFLPEGTVTTRNPSREDR